MGVDPRVCGETAPRPVLWVTRYGRSPRVRGNPIRPAPHPHAVRSIPACAGKPGHVRASCGLGRVDPRVCGETSSFPSASPATGGRSPRVRGNRWGDGDGERAQGSIPACAGKPHRRRIGFLLRSVDPRVCGETLRDVVLTIGHVGRSPRVRGNHADLWSRVSPSRSIPACAGKPGHGKTLRAVERVDPRVCGETRPLDSSDPISRGRSPRVRGNRRRRGHTWLVSGSIPACAGKPLIRRLPVLQRKVDPRVCGETCYRVGEDSRI